MMRDLVTCHLEKARCISPSSQVNGWVSQSIPGSNTHESSNLQVLVAELQFLQYVQDFSRVSGGLEARVCLSSSLTPYANHEEGCWKLRRLYADKLCLIYKVLPTLCSGQSSWDICSLAVPMGRAGSADFQMGSRTLWPSFLYTPQSSTLL